MAKRRAKRRTRLTASQQECVSRKASIITREEKAKPRGKRRTRRAIVGKAVGICRGLK